MKNLTVSLLAILAFTGAHSAELHLNTIKNQTVHEIEWEKLPLPGMLGKMRPVLIDRFGTVQPDMPLIPPVTLSFKNSNKHSRAVFVELTLVQLIQKRLVRPGEDPKKLALIELNVSLKDAEGNVIKNWNQRINPSFSYHLDVTLKGSNLHKTEVTIMGHGIPIIMGHGIPVIRGTAQPKDSL